MITMKTLIEKAKHAHDSAPRGVVVAQSIPILYFGDYDAFQGSDLRVVTVGLNPGPNAFPEEDPWYKFPAHEESYQRAWNQYFKRCPKETRPRRDRELPRKLWEEWFTSLDNVLHGFDASFYFGDGKNTALHTDLLSPVATNPAWSHLHKSDQVSLMNLGIPLWHDLIVFLKPRIVLISVAERYRQEIVFDVVQGWRKSSFSVKEKRDGILRREPYDVLHSVVRITSDYHTHLLFGRAANTPFGTLSNDGKKRIGKELKNRLTNWQDS